MKSWTKSDTLVLAMDSCTVCQGTGIRPGSRNTDSPCNCVLRAIFRICYDKFQTCARKESSVTQVHLERSTGGASRSFRWSRKDEEFVADFYLVAKRNLDELEWKLFRLHFLLGADWRLCCDKLKLDRGNFFHAVYRIEQKLGRVFSELEPYALFPLDEYFGGSTKPVCASVVVPIRPEPMIVPIRSAQPKPKLPDTKAA